MRKRFPRCSCACKDGSQCGRRVTDGSQPPICHVHRAQINGTSISPLTIPFAATTVDREAMYQTLMRDPDSSIRLRALEAFEKREERLTKGCATCAERATHAADIQDFIARCDLAQAERLDFIFAQYEDLKREVFGLPEPAATAAVPIADPTEGGRFIKGDAPGVWIEVSSGDEYTDEDYVEEPEDQ